MARLKPSPSPIVTAVKVMWRIRSRFTVIKRALLNSHRVESCPTLFFKLPGYGGSLVVDQCIFNEQEI